MNVTSNNKRPVENWVVGKQAVALYNTGGSGNNLTSSGNVVLADHQLGFFSTSNFGGTVANNVATDTTPTVAEAPVLAIYQGTANSATSSTATATYPLAVRAYEKTGDIDGTTAIQITKQLYVAPTHNIWIIGAATGTAGEIIATDSTEYALSIAYRGRMIEELYSNEAAAQTRVQFVTPNYTALATAEPVDHLLQNLAFQINRNSKSLNLSPKLQGKDPVIAFLLASTGSTGVLISGLTAGSVVPVANTTYGVRSITLTAAMAASIIAGVTATAATSGFSTADYILLGDTLTAGTVTGGVADGILLMALDRQLAYQDYIPQVKTKLIVGLTRGFNYATTYSAKAYDANEGQGVARTLELQYQATQGQRKYNLQHVEVPVVTYPSPIDLTETYVTYNIHHGSTNAVDTNHTSFNPKKEIVLVPSANTTLVTAMDTALNAYLASGNNPAVVTI